jgi:plastocyanin
MRRLTRLVTIAALGLMWPGAPLRAVDDEGKPATHTVTIDALRYSADTLSVKAGDTVVWVNKDPFPHTVTSKKGGFDSSQIEPGESWKLVTKTKGEFEYICAFHPTMKATLRVN